MPPPDRSSGPQAEPESRQRFGRHHSNQHHENSPTRQHNASDARKSGGGRGAL